MEYIKAIIWSLFYLILFDFTLGRILNLLQYLGNLFHKYVGRIFIIYKEYLMCVLLSTFTETYVEKHGMNANILLAFFTFILFLFTITSYKDTVKNDITYGGHNSTSAALIGISFMILIWFIYYSELYILTEPVLWFMNIISSILNIPILGDIITIVGNVATGAILIYMIFMTIVLLFAIVSNFFPNKTSKASSTPPPIERPIEIIRPKIIIKHQQTPKPEDVQTTLEQETNYETH